MMPGWCGRLSDHLPPPTNLQHCFSLPDASALAKFPHVQHLRHDPQRGALALEQRVSEAAEKPSPAMVRKPDPGIVVQADGMRRVRTPAKSNSGFRRE
jgi:hypothetical protein